MIPPLVWHIVEPDLIIPGIQKVAGASIGLTFRHQVMEYEAMTYPRRLAFIRHPVSRLVSAFRHLIDVGYCIERTWEDFVDYMLVNEDRHWYPQEPRLYYEGEWMPSHIERLENLKQVWPKYTKKKFPHLNKTVGKQSYDTSYREEDLERYYAKDLELWNGLA